MQDWKRPETLVSHLIYASRVIQTRSQYLLPGGYRPLEATQGNNITLVHSDEPYMQQYGKLMEIRFHELENESKMRILKTHSQISEWRGYDVKALVRWVTGKRLSPTQTKPYNTLPWNGGIFRSRPADRIYGSSCHQHAVSNYGDRGRIFFQVRHGEV